MKTFYRQTTSHLQILPEVTSTLLLSLSEPQDWISMALTLINLFRTLTWILLDHLDHSLVFQLVLLLLH
jgi:hypothetical protein